MPTTVGEIAIEIPRTHCIASATTGDLSVVYVAASEVTEPIVLIKKHGANRYLVLDAVSEIHGSPGNQLQVKARVNTSIRDLWLGVIEQMSLRSSLTPRGALEGMAVLHATNRALQRATRLEQVADMDELMGRRPEDR